MATDSSTKRELVEFSAIEREINQIYNKCVMTDAASDNPCVIDTSILIKKTNALDELNHIIVKLSELRLAAVRCIDDINIKSETVRTKLLKILDENIIDENPTTTVVASNAWFNNVKKKAIVITDAATNTVAPPSPSPTTPIYFTDKHFLSAYKVKSIAEVKNIGVLYFIEPMNHFAMMIGNLLLHGNIGNIYTNERNPQKIKDCRFSSCLKNTCAFYHSPVKFTGSRDYRNFIAGSWVYAIPNSPMRESHKSRVFGSRENIAFDLTTIDSEDIEIFNDQLMHDILCGMLLKKYFCAPKASSPPQ